MITAKRCQIFILKWGSTWASLALMVLVLRQHSELISTTEKSTADLQKMLIPLPSLDKALPHLFINKSLNFEPNLIISKGRKDAKYVIGLTSTKRKSMNLLSHPNLFPNRIFCPNSVQNAAVKNDAMQLNFMH